MTWIETIDEDEARGPLAEIYRRVADRGSGRVDSIMKVHALHPDGLAAHFGLYSAVMRGTRTLPRSERELIALVVSVINGCRY